MGDQGSKTGYSLSGGGAGAPWNWGVSPFDLGAINAATGQNVQDMENRYQQLGLGGSTMEAQDVAGANQAGQAMIGQEQTANVGQPALNPALQPQVNQLIGVGGNQASQLGGAAGAALGALLPAAAAGG